VPAGKAVPLFLVLGGGGAQGGAGIDNNTKMSVIADRYGFVAAFVTSVSVFNGRGHGWRNSDHMSSEDVDWIRHEIIRIVKAGGIDKRRVFVVGTSIGGSMAYRIGCALSTRVAGIGSVGGIMFMKKCKPARAMSVLTIVGDRDTGFIGKPGIVAPLTTSKRWARLDRCGVSGATTRSGIVTTTLWSGCSDHSKVGLTSIAGGNHGWPGVRPYDAGDAFWQFFQGVRLPRSSRP
jgi:polyhydroxybutyrate depolymerase